ncbi:MAG: molecular chaperone HtpG [Bacilli bacterium]|jgi:molecular chaperone HtpG|nr:molecular chaperone HtpG [Bacilli bacterium]
MAKKQFKAESKKLMDLMINSIYTNKEIFLRELISNASDAIDKLYYKSLTDDSIKINKKDFKIEISVDENNRTLKITDNGIGMNLEELETNLGTIAKSGSGVFKKENEHKKDIDIIGQFGVGFYSAFMVSDKIEVTSKAYGEKSAHKWVSTGIDGYEIKEANKDNYGTEIILTIKESTEEFDYSEFLNNYKLESIIKKYSDYITYPIVMNKSVRELKDGSEDEYIEKEEETTINDMIPLWKRNKSKIKENDYNTFYSDKFFDYEAPLKVIHTSTEGLVSYNSLLFIPSHPAYDFYTKNYEKGLQLYSSGVLIMEKCAELLPDYYNFVKGVVDSEDLSLNISREILQQDKMLKTIAKSIETKITKELTDMLKNERETYEKFFTTFGTNIKFGVYDNFGANKDKLKDLLMFISSKTKKFITLKEYVDNNKDSDSIYYCCGETIDKIDNLPLVENYKDKDIEILYCTDYMDEFVLQTLMNYNDKKFVNISTSETDLSTDAEKEKLEKHNESSKDLFKTMQEAIPEVSTIRFTNKLKKHPVCLSSKGNVSIEMEKVINAMPTDEKLNAEKVLEINENHEIVKKLENLQKENKEELKKYTKILYAQARLIEGLPIENPTEVSSLICEVLSK